MFTVTGVTGILRGLLAVRGLLKGAKEIPSETTIIREFEKPGGYGHTINDFLSVHPTNIRTFDVVDGVRTFRRYKGEFIIVRGLLFY